MKVFLHLFLFMVCITSVAQEKQTFYFDFDIDEVNSSSLKDLDKWILANKEAVIQKVYGYTDSVGSIEYNEKLSERRAQDMFERLKSFKVRIPKGIDVRGFGENFEQDAEQAKNRKVEVYYHLPIKEKKVEKTETTELTQKIDNSKTGDRLKLPNLYFYNHSDIVVPGSRPVLSELLVIMRNRPKLKIDIQGHICCQEQEVANISEKRAKAVYDFLVRNGIDKSRLSYQGFQSSRPVYPLPEKNDEERDANRRVEIEIIEN